MKLESLRALYVEQLRDLYSAEDQLTDALPKMAKAATNAQLKQAFEAHLGQTEQQRDRLKQVLDGLDEKASGHTCKAMKGLIKEGDEMIANKGDDAVLDAGLIAAAQRVEHYEIAGYGTVVTYAEMLGRQDDLRLLKQTLEEEKSTDDKLNRIAKDVVNPAAAKA